MMRRAHSRIGILAFLLVALAGPGRADVWDPGDDDNGTTNALLPGGVQQHNLIAVAATTDQDWYRVHVPPRSSFEWIMDAMGPGIAGATDPFTLVASAGTLVANSTNLLETSRSILFDNTTGSDLF